MTTLTIFIAPITRQILLTEYGGVEPLRFQRRDLLYDQLRAIKIGSAGYGRKTLQWLSATITLEVHDDLAKIVSNKNTNVGMALYNFHVDMLMRYVEALTSCGIAASAAIHRFFEKYDISEDDYAYETAYRRWTWYKSEMEKNSGKTRTNSRSHVSGFSGLGRRVKLLASDPVLEERIQLILTRLHESGRSLPQAFSRHLTYYIYYMYGGYTMRVLARKLHTPRATISDGIQILRNWLHTDAVVADLVSEALRRD